MNVDSYAPQTCELRQCQTLGISHTPVQKANWSCVYSPETALARGTMFPELDLPYLGTGRINK